MRRALPAVTVLILSILYLVAIQAHSVAQPADNTGINKRDQSSSEPTADQQGQSKADIDLTQKIRRSIVNDKSLSVDARNVKIITINGFVTLKGPVASEQEKRSVEDKAVRLAGNDKVRSELDVAPRNERK